MIGRFAKNKHWSRIQKMTKEIEKIIKKVQGDADRRFGVMMDEINSSFKIVADQFKGVFEKLDDHGEKLDNLTADMAEVKSDLRGVNLTIKHLNDSKLDKKHFADLDGRLRKLEKK